ncbi:hypothetical protein HDU79_012045 [Rhizoclosmatium sp. JEL0117]|nr:hypothetical protein HDU79_012045 [Rhizoclosmatium sp. JEL0117]
MATIDSRPSSTQTLLGLGLQPVAAAKFLSSVRTFDVEGGEGEAASRRSSLKRTLGVNLKTGATLATPTRMASPVPLQSIGSIGPRSPRESLGGATLALDDVLDVDEDEDIELDRDLHGNQDPRINTLSTLRSTARPPSLQVPDWDEPLIAYMDPERLPICFSDIMPAELEGTLAVATYSARIRELNAVIASEPSLSDYTPVYRAASLAVLTLWTTTSAVVFGIRSTTLALSPWYLMDTLLAFVSVIGFVMALLLVRHSFKMRPLEYLEKLRSLMHRYTLIDAPHHLIWQLHTCIGSHVSHQVFGSSLFKQQYIKQLHHAGVGFTDSHMPIPTVSLFPVKPVVWFSVEKQEYELVVESSGNFVISPPARASRFDSDTVHAGRRDLDVQSRMGLAASPVPHVGSMPALFEDVLAEEDRVDDEETAKEKVEREERVQRCCAWCKRTSSHQGAIGGLESEVEEL